MINFPDSPPQVVRDDLAALRDALDASIPPKTLDRNVLIAIWNIRGFGQVTPRGPSEPRTRRNGVWAMCSASPRSSRAFDVIALQEVKRDLGGLRLLMRALGPSYALRLRVSTIGRRGAILSTAAMTQLLGTGSPNGPGIGRFARWFRYPAGFSPQALASCLRRVGLRNDALVVDPFAGAGTAGLDVLARGGRFVGIEAHPLIADLSRLKFEDPPELVQLKEAAAELVSIGTIGPVAQETDLVRACFDEQTLGLLVGLRSAVPLVDSSLRPYLKWALLGALRDCANKKVGWPHQRPALSRTPRITHPYRAFLRRVGWMIDDLREWAPKGRATVVCGDSRSSTSWQLALAGEAATACITSPPYLNNFDYGDATRLEMYFWGTAASWADLRRVTHSVMVSSSTQQTTKRAAAEAWIHVGKVAPTTTARLAPLVEQLAALRLTRPGRKEYDRLIPMYFSGLADVLRLTRDNSAAGAPLLMVLGDSAPYSVYIDTPELIRSLATELGFRTEPPVTLRRRGLRWVSNGPRHGIPLREAVVVLESPGPGDAR